jgi:hypothetical protein
MLNNIFQGVARPLKVRVQQVLGGQLGIVIVYKLQHLLEFYSQTLVAMLPSSPEDDGVTGVILL